MSTLTDLGPYGALQIGTEVILGKPVTYGLADPDRAGLGGRIALFAVNGFETTWEVMWKRGGPMGVVGSVMNGTFDLLDCDSGDTAVFEAIEEFVGDTLVNPVVAPLKFAAFATVLSFAGGGASNVIVSTNGGIAQAAGGNGGGSSGGGNGGQTPDQFDDGGDEIYGNEDGGNQYLAPNATFSR
jgi:hypothetical protein